MNARLLAAALMGLTLSALANEGGGETGENRWLRLSAEEHTVTAHQRRAPAFRQYGVSGAAAPVSLEHRDELASGDRVSGSIMRNGLTRHTAVESDRGPLGPTLQMRPAIYHPSDALRAVKVHGASDRVRSGVIRF